MISIPISDVIPLAQWIQIYHAFRVKLDICLYQTGETVLGLHRTRLGPESQPGVWETQEYIVFVTERTITFEVPESSYPDEAAAAFSNYQAKLFGNGAV
jgi:hypothetical protein